MHFRLSIFALLAPVLWTLGYPLPNHNTGVPATAMFPVPLEDSSLFRGGYAKFPPAFAFVSCAEVLEDFGDATSSIYKGGESKDTWQGCRAELLNPEGDILAGIYKGGNSTTVLLDCAPPLAFSNEETKYHTGGSSADVAVSCAVAAVLLPEGEKMGIYKGGSSNDYFVACLEKPAVIDLDLPMYQGGRSYLEMLDCETYQLGKGNAFVGGDSREMAVACEVKQMEGISIFMGDSSAFMMSSTACYVTPESLTGENRFGGNVSRPMAVACVDSVMLGDESVGVFYHGGNSSAAFVDCYENPCLQLLPAKITASGTVPVCVGKDLTLKASAADSRKWQYYEGGAWTDVSTAAQITINSTLAGDYRLISYSVAGCSDTSAIFVAEFVTNIPQPVITVGGSTLLCQGGSVALFSSPSHSYLWSTGDTTQMIWATNAGIYTVTITDENGCSALSDVVELTSSANTVPVVDITPSGRIELCKGESQTLTSTEAISYQWSNGATTQDVLIDRSGKYTVRITDENGCQASADSVEVVVHDVRPVIKHDNLTICYGAAMDLSIAPHSGTIQWYKDGSMLSGKTTPAISVDEVGYYYAILDTLGCHFSSDTVTVFSNGNVPKLANISASHPVLCAGGTVVFTADSASKYAWSTGEDSRAIWTDKEGVYTLTVEDEYGCVSTDSYTLNKVEITLQPVIQITKGQLDLCPGDSVSLRVSEGETFRWNTEELAQSITVYYESPGFYSATAYDANGCSVMAEAVEVVQHPEVIPVIEYGFGVICGNEPLELGVLPEAASYLWSNGATTQTIDILTAGKYSVTITTDEGCKFTADTVTITAAPAPVKPVISSSYTITNDTIWICPNQIGTVTLTSTTADAYEWSNGETTQSITPDTLGNFVLTVYYATTCEAVSDTLTIALRDRSVFIEAVDGMLGLCPEGHVTLKVGGAADGSTFIWNGNPTWNADSLIVTAAGKYYVTVTGAGGCAETTDTLEVYNFPAVVPMITADGNTNMCPYDSLLITASYGEAYLWNTGATSASIYANSAGIYTVTVTDEYGCNQQAFIDITTKPQQTPVIATVRDTICQGETLLLSAPAEGTSFLWNTGETTQSITYDNPARFGNMTYWVEVSYPEGCTFRSPDKVINVKKQPRQPEITVVGSNQICPDRTVALVSTKSDSYTYLWNTGETASAIVVDQNGDYHVTVTDIANGCSTRSEILELNTLSSAEIQILPKGPVSLCEKGWVQLTAYASQENVKYFWNTGDTTKSIIVNQEGFYRVQVTSLVQGQECTIESRRVEVVEMPAFPTPTVTISGALTFCDGGNVTLISSISPDGRYEWFRWTETDSVLVGNSRTLDVQQSGTYFVVHADNQNCKLASTLLKVTVNPVPEALISPDGIFTLCANDSIVLTANAGNGYKYRWSNGDTSQAVKVSLGTYTVKVTTPQGCFNASFPVEIRQSNNQAPMPDANNVGVCEGEKAILSATSTIDNPNFKWWDASVDGNIIGYSDTLETANLNTNYEVWVNVSSDEYCESPRRKVFVSVGPKIAVNIVTDDSLSVCNFATPLALDATPAGGIFSGAGVTGNHFDPSLSGSGMHAIYYTVTTQGCPSVDSIVVNVQAVPSVYFQNVPDTLCDNDVPLQIDVYPADGTLSGAGVTDLTFDPHIAGAGVHWLKYTVFEGICSTTDSVKIIVLQAPQPIITNTQTVVGLTTARFELIAIPTGGIFDGNGVVFDNGKAYFDPATAGVGMHDITYTVDNGNCTGIAHLVIIVGAKPAVTTPDKPVAVCENNFLSPDVPAYDIYGGTLISEGWLLKGNPFNPLTDKVTYANNGDTLKYKVVSNYGETISDGVAITVNAKPLITAITAPNAICAGNKITPQTPVITERGAGVTARGWLLDNAPFDPVTTDLTYADNGKTLKYYAASLCGNDTTAAVTVTVNAAPLIALIHATPTVCVGGTLSLTLPAVTDRGATRGNAYWVFDGQPVDLSTKTFDNADAGKELKYVVESSCGTAESNSAIVQISTKSIAPDITMNPANGVICGTGNVTLSTSSYASYQWYKNGVVYSTDASITINETNADNYTVIGYSAGGCESELSDVASVSVQTPPVPSINGATTVCENSPENYTITGLAGSTTDYTYAWAISGGAIQGSSTQAAVNVKWTQTGPHTLSVTVTHTASGCTGNANSTVIAVKAKPSITGITAPAAVCAGNALSLNTPSVTWNGATETGQGWLLDGVAFNPATAVTYADDGKTLKYYAASSCGNDTTAGVQIVVNAVPAIAAIADTVGVCVGGKLIITAPGVTERGVAATDAYWTLNNVRVDLSTKIFATTDNLAELKYVVTSVCGATESNTAIIKLGVKPAAPLITTDPANGIICGEGSVTLSASGYHTYQWYKDGTALSTQASIIIDETQVGSVYTVKGFSIEGCESELSAAASVSVRALPTPSITGAAIVCEHIDENYILAGLTGNASDYSYAWTVSGGAIQGSSTQSGVDVKWNYGSTYSVGVTVTHTASGCAASTNITAITVNAKPQVGTLAVPAAVCEGGFLTLQVPAATERGATATGHGWLLNGIPFVPVTTALTYADNGKILKYYITSACGNDTTAGVSISVHTKPLVAALTTPAAICSGGTLTLHTPGITVRGAVVTQQGWLLDGAAFNPATILSQTDNGKLLKYYAASACGNDTTAGVVVTINTKPTLGVLAVPPVVCDGGKLTPQEPVISDPAAVTSQGWLLNGVAFDPANTVLTMVDDSSDLQYYITSACGNDTTAAVLVRVNAVATLTITNPAAVCEGVSVNLRTAVPLNDSLNYTFFDVDQNTELAKPDSVYAPAGFSVYYVSSTNKYTGCQSVKTPVTLNVHEMPTVRIETLQDTNVCHNSTIELKAVTSGEVIWVGWYDKNGLPDNNAQFASNPHESVVVYNPTYDEAGHTIKLFVRVRDEVCGYVADTIDLRILPLPTEVDFELITQPQTYQEMCTDTLYELKVKATGLGDLNNLKVRLHDINATGIAIKDAAVKYPYTTADWDTLAVETADITGTIWAIPNALPQGDSLLIQVTVAPECNFFSGANLNFNLSAESVCGDKLTPDKVVTTGNFYTKQDTVQLNTYDVFSEFTPDKVTNNTGDTITWRLKAVVHGLQPTDSTKESMVALIPAGLTPIINSYNPVKNAPDRASLSAIIDEFGIEFGLPVKSGLVEGDTIIAELQFSVTGAPCGDYDFYAEVIFSDSINCHGTHCLYNSTRGGVYPVLTIERYTFSLVDSVYGKTVDGLWYGHIPVQVETQFYAGDSIYIDFYIDRDNNSTLTPGDTLVCTFTHITSDVPAQGKFTVHFDSVHVESQKQLLAVVRGDALCAPVAIPVATLMGADTVCQLDTALYYTVPGMQDYKWDVVVDAVSGATPQRIPLEGSTEANYANESVARIVWKKQGDYSVWAQYTIPAEGYEVSRTYFPIHVNQRPVLVFTGAQDTSICEASRIELSHFFRDTTHAGTLSFYKKETDETYTFLSNQIPFYVEPENTTIYKVTAVSEEGCDAIDALEFQVNVSKMPQIMSIAVIAQPNCGTTTGAIGLNIVGGSGSYEYSLNRGATYADLPYGGTIENLPVGDYWVYVKDKVQLGCAPSISESVNLSAANSGLFASAQVSNATDCGSNDGSIRLSVNGGVAPYRYKVNDDDYKRLPADGVIGTGLAAGYYSITVMDTTGCTTSAGGVQIRMVSGVNINLHQLTPAACDTEGTAEISISGGTPAYRYKLSGKGWMPVSGGTKDTIALGAGLHEIVVIDGNGCIVSDTISMEASAGGISATILEVSKAPCNGVGGGDVRLNIVGGVEPISYSIDGGNYRIPIASGISVINDLPVGTYHIMLFDDNNCSFSLEGVKIEEELNFVQAVDNRVYTYKTQAVSGNLSDDDFNYNQSEVKVVHHANPLHGAIIMEENGAFTYTPDADFVGQDSLQYTVENACKVQSSAWLYIYVLDKNVATNRPPIALDDEYVIKMGQSLLNFEVRKNDIDPDGDALSNPVVITDVLRGTLTQNGDGTFNYRPDPNFVGVEIFTYSVCDPYNACAEAQVHITVLPDIIYNNYIIALPDAYSVARGDTLKVTNPVDGMLNNDSYPQGSTPVITVIDSTENGTLTINPSNGTFTYIPNEYYSGFDRFSYCLCTDLPVDCDSTWVTIFVVEGACTKPITMQLRDTVTICEGDSVNLLTTVLPGSINIDTLAFYTDRQYQTEITNRHIKAQGMYYAVASNAAGCNAYDSMYVKVVPSPVLNLSGRSVAICSGASVYIIADTANCTSIVWDNYSSGGVVTGVMSDTLHFTSLPRTNDTTFFIYVTAYGDSPCVVLQDSVEVTIYATPAAPSAITAVNYCVGAPALPLTATPTGTNWLKWYDAGNNLLSMAPTPSTTTAGTTTYKVSQANASCESPEVEIVVTVQALPSASIQEINPAVEVLQTIHLTGTTDGTLVKWESSDTSIAKVNAATGYVTGISNGTVMIRYIVINTAGCRDTASVLVTVHPLTREKAAITPQDITLCVGDSITFTATGGGTFVKWDCTHSSCATIDTITGKVIGLAAGNCEIQYISSYADNSLDTVVVILTVKALPTVQINQVNPTVCVGKQLLLTGTTDGTLTTWRSVSPAIAIINAQTGEITGMTAGTTNIRYVVQNENGCADSATVVLTVLALPAVQPITGSLVICEGATTQLLNATPGGVWKSAGEDIATVTAGGLVTGHRPGVAAIHYVVSNSNGCSDSVTVQVTVNTTTDIIAQPVDGHVIEGRAHTMTVVAAGAGLTYQWQKQVANTWVDITGATGASYTIDSVAREHAGYYRVIVQGLCGSDTSHVAELDINPCLPDIIYFQWPDVPTVNNNAKTNGGRTFVKYQWYQNGLAILGATRPYYQPVQAQMGDNFVYYCVMTTSTGEQVETCPFIVPVTITPGANAYKPFVVFPNPVGRGQDLTVQTGMEGSAGEFEINIYDLNGELRKQYRSPLTIIKIPAPENQGYYLLQLKAKDGTVRNATFVVH